VRLRFIGEFARFENLDSFGAEFEPVISSAMNANQNFDEASSISSYTIPSKMNAAEDNFNFDQLDETPF